MRYRVLLCLLLACPGAYAAETPIDSVKTLTGYLTGTKPDTVAIHVRGRDIHSPFTWSLTVKDSNGVVIYSNSHDDAWLDEFFSDDQYVLGCKGYEECKRHYYFELIPGRIQECLKAAPQSWLSNKFMAPIFHEVAANKLKEAGVPAPAAKVAIEEMQESLSSAKTQFICEPYSAVKDQSPLVWVPSIRKFLAFYEE